MSSDSQNSVQASLARAVQCHQAGQLPQAEAIYRHILDDDPAEPNALHLLGVLCHQRGQYGLAAGLIRRALAICPDQPHFHGNLSDVLRSLGDLAEAHRRAEAAIRLQPEVALFHNTLAVALQRQGFHLEAIESLREAIRLDLGAGLGRSKESLSNPVQALYHNNLGLSLLQLRRFDEALVAFREAIRLAPSLAIAHSNLSQLLLNRLLLDQALFHCQEALRLRPDYAEAQQPGERLEANGAPGRSKSCYQQILRLPLPDSDHGQCRAMAHNNLGQALQEESQFDEAVACYQQALAIEPNSARFLTNLASAVNCLERKVEARDLCQRALQSDSTYGNAHALLASLVESEGDLAGAAAGYREALRFLPDGAENHVSLGHVLAAQGERDLALACFRTALEHQPNHPGAYSSLATTLAGKLPDVDLENALTLLAGPLTPAQESALRFGLAHVMDGRGRYAEAAEYLLQANRLCSQLLARQGKDYSPTDHNRFVDQLLTAFDSSHFARVAGWGSDSDNPVFIVGLPRSGTTLTEQILASHRQVHGAGEQFFARQAFEGMPALLGLREAAELCVPHYTRGVVRNLADHYLQHLRSLAPGAVRIVDKLPGNYLYLGLLATLFPRARFIHTRRDIRDTALSCWLTDFKDIRWACDLGHIASHIRTYQRLMEHWRRVLPVPLLEVDYEETVADLEGTAHRLVDWCGLDWDPACLEFHKTRRPVRTASVHQVRQPIYTHSVGRWKNYADALAPLLERFG